MIGAALAPEVLTAIQVVVGAALGALAAVLHQRLLARAIARGVARRRASAFVIGAPLRVGAPALILLGLARWGRPALLAGAIALALAAAIGAARGARAAAGPRPEEGR